MADIQDKDIRSNFDLYWIKTLLPALETKEKLRQKYLSRFWLMLILAFCIVPMIIIAGYILNRHFNKTFDPNLIFLIIAGTVFILQRPYHHYKKQIKQDIMPLFVKYFDGFTYQYNQGLTLDELEDSRIFPRFDTYSADDCFKGSYQGIHMRIMEERLKVYRRTKHGQREVSVFKGVAIELNLQKMFTSHTIVLKDAGIFNKLKRFSNLERIRLEDPKFEKIFEVYGSDQIEARTQLTPVFMERILKLKNLYKGKSVQFSFFEGKLLIAIATNQDMFEPFSFFKTNINKKKIDMVFEQFLTIFEIINILKLASKTNLSTQN